MKLIETVNVNMALNYILSIIKEEDQLTVDNKDLVEADVWFGDGSTLILLTFEDTAKRIELYLKNSELSLEFNNNYDNDFCYKLFIMLLNKIRSYKQWING